MTNQNAKIGQTSKFLFKIVIENRLSKTNQKQMKFQTKIKQKSQQKISTKNLEQSKSLYWVTRVHTGTKQFSFSDEYKFGQKMLVL